MADRHVLFFIDKYISTSLFSHEYREESYGEYALAAAIDIVKPDLAFIDIQLKESENR